MKTINSEYQRICRYCKVQFQARHLNQWYCTPECKSREYCRKVRETNEMKSTETKKLDSNERILAEMLRKGISVVKADDLKNNGFYDSVYSKRFEMDKRWIAVYDHFTLEALPGNVYKIRKI
jgi:hypothetical protein